MVELLTTEQMKEVDDYSIRNIGIPSMVLMERAALSVTKEILLRKECVRVLCICGKGNNGADGLAVARQLSESGISVDVMIVGNQEKPGTQEFEIQLGILDKIGVKVSNNVQFYEYNFIVDAIFGIGLSRDVSGRYREIVETINDSRQRNPHQQVISVDIPSGIDASSGCVMGCAVKADITVTFGFQKLGMVFYPGAEYAGNVKVAQIGFAPLPLDYKSQYAFTYTKEDLSKIPIRKADSNKGTYGKVLIIAGSKDCGGAACLSAQAAYRSGCGLVKVMTHKSNKTALLCHVPEAVLSTYDEETDIRNLLEEEMNWASCVVIGPGLSTRNQAHTIVSLFLEQMAIHTTIRAIMDADALNLIAKDPSLDHQLKEVVQQSGAEKRVIITPHMGELSRLTGLTIEEIKQDKINNALKVAQKFGVICVMKDARTVVSDGNHVYVNTSGNSGMATAGSGDVLTGILAGMNITQMNILDAACMGVYVHGLAGDDAAGVYGTYGMKAGDMPEYVPKILIK